MAIAAHATVRPTTIGRRFLSFMPLPSVVLTLRRRRYDRRPVGGDTTIGRLGNNLLTEPATDARTPSARTSVRASAPRFPVPFLPRPATASAARPRLRGAPCNSLGWAGTAR